MKKELVFPHKADPEKVCRNLEPDLQAHAEKHGLTLSKPGPRSYRLSRTFAELNFTVTDSDLQVTVDLAWVVPGSVAKQVVDGLNDGMPTLLRKCEKS